MKIYFDQNIIKEYNREWVPFLYPILGEIRKEDRHGTWFYDENQIEKWIKEGKNLIHFENDVSKCDYIVYPIDFHYDYIDSFENQCKIGMENNKKVIVFYFNDNEQPIPNKYNNIIVFRVSLNQSNPENEFAMPGFTADLGKIYGINHKVNNLSIGYAGYYGYYNLKTFFEYILIKLKFLLFDNKITYSLILSNKWLTNLGIKLERMGLIHDGGIFRDSLIYFLTAKGKGIIYRKKIIKIIESTKIPSKIIRRKKMLGTVVKHNLRDEYVYNIVNTEFPLVIRGNGNYSYRLSEVLSLGKIPLFINTNCRLPFENIIDYKKNFCWCYYRDSKIEDTITAFYKKNDLLKIQENIRYIYEKYFSFLGFHKTIVEILMK